MEVYRFKSPGQWSDFSYYVKNQNRYVLNKGLEEFKKNIIKSAKKRQKELKKGKIFYRARIGHKIIKSKKSLFEKNYPLAKKKMFEPPREEAIEGRINPAGISYFYLSSNKTTAISETRPWISQLVSVATFEIKNTLKVVDVRSNSDFLKLCLPWEKNATQQQKEDRIWWSIDRDFSEPIIEGKVNVGYVPSQYLSEIFKNAGYKGIIYRSSLSKQGYNLVLFDFLRKWDIAIKKVELFKVSGLKYSAKIYRNL